MNIRSENVCTGTGVHVGHGRDWSHTECHHCGRRVRVRVTGALHKHSKKGRR